MTLKQIVKMIKAFQTAEEYNNYVKNGLISGEQYYVIADNSLHFRTNSIDGTDKVYNISEGSNSYGKQFTAKYRKL